MKTTSIFDIVCHGGTIHDIAREAAANGTVYWQQGKACYRFWLQCRTGNIQHFDGCFDGRLLAVVPDKGLCAPRFACIRSVPESQKHIIEQSIMRTADGCINR